MSFWLTIFTHMFLIWFRGGGDFEIQAQSKSEFESIFPELLLISAFSHLNGMRWIRCLKWWMVDESHTHTHTNSRFLLTFFKHFFAFGCGRELFYHLMIFHDNFRIVKNFFSFLCVCIRVRFIIRVCVRVYAFASYTLFSSSSLFDSNVVSHTKFSQFVSLSQSCFHYFVFSSLVFWTTLNFFATKSQFSLQWKFQNRKFPFSTLFLSVFSFFFFTTFTTVVFAVALHTNCSIFSFWREKLHGKLTGKLSPEHQYQRNVCARI